MIIKKQSKEYREKLIKEVEEVRDEMQANNNTRIYDKFCLGIEACLDFFCNYILKIILFPFALCCMLCKRLRLIFKKDIPYYFDKYQKWQSPLQYYSGWFWDSHHDIKHAFRYAIKDPNQYLAEVIPVDWCDKCELSRNILFAMLINFVEKEKCFEVVYYDTDDKNRKLEKEIKKLYNYCKLKEEQKLRIFKNLIKILPEKEIYKILPDFETWLPKENGKIPEQYLEDLLVDALEEKFDTEVMHRITNIRMNLWT